MRRANIYTLTSAIMVLGGAAVASAQTAPVGISLRAGLFFPTSSGVTSATGSTWFAFGAEYKLFDVSKNSSNKQNVSLSIDYFSRNKVDETPILLNYVYHFSSVYATAGLGASFDHTVGNSRTHLGYEVGLGYDLPVSSIPVFVEAKFWGNDFSGYDGVGVYAGVRF